MMSNADRWGDSLTMNDYQLMALDYAVYNDEAHAIIYPALGLAGETGEVIEKVKKHLRDGKAVYRDVEVLKELGDVLWYLSVLSDDLGWSLADVASTNLDKLKSRKTRGVLHGDGDNR